MWGKSPVKANFCATVLNMCPVPSNPVVAMVSIIWVLGEEIEVLADQAFHRVINYRWCGSIVFLLPHGKLKYSEAIAAEWLLSIERSQQASLSKMTIN